MTDKELHKMKRSELIELMYYMRQEIDALREENAKLNQRIDLLLNDNSSPLPMEPEAETEVVVGKVVD